MRLCEEPKATKQSLRKTTGIAKPVPSEARDLAPRKDDVPVSEQLQKMYCIITTASS